MKYLKIFENFNSDEKIHEICKKHNIENYTINKDHSIDVDDDVNLYRKGLTKIPLKFRKVSGYFDCDDNSLTSLEGSPTSVGGDFYCDNNKLTSLEGSPTSVGGYFYCNDNPVNEVYNLFNDKDKIELLNDYDIFRKVDGKPGIILDRLNSFLEDIGKESVTKVEGYINIQFNEAPKNI